MYSFIEKHMQRIVALDPRTSALETLINNPLKIKQEGWGGHNYYDTTITERGVDTVE